MAIAVQNAHTAAVIAALQAQGLTVGDATGKGLALPFAVVYDISDRTGGNLGAPHDDSQFTYQVTCVGREPAEARYVRQKAMSLLSGLTVAGRRVVDVDFQDGSGGIGRDDDQDPPLYNAKPRFVLWSTPS